MKLDDIGSEYRGALLGDPRRTKRLQRIALELARNPGLSFPEAMGSEGQLEGLYRFLNNEEVSFEAVHAPHAEQTRVRCAPTVPWPSAARPVGPPCHRRPT